VLAELLSHGYPGRVARVASSDRFIPLGDAALQVLLSEDTIEAAAVKLMGNRA
jgi:2-oxoisovalerate dehydrogenase E1 component